MTTLNESQAISLLCVEDDQQSRDILITMLMTKYPKVIFHAADSGLQGMQLFREFHPDIVVTDINIPELDGLSMASEIKVLCPETIIIAVTASSNTNNLLKAIEIGISNYIIKPLVFEQIYSILDQAITTIRKEQQLRSRFEQINFLNATLAARTRELEAANNDLEAFNYTVAHDLKTPLVCIGGFSKYILDNQAKRLDKKSKGYLNVIFNETIRMNELIEALLTFSSHSRKEIVKQWTDLSNIANEVKCNLLTREPQRSVTFIIADGVMGFCDQVLIGVVMENLIDNAWKYSANKVNAHIEFGVMNEDAGLIYFIRDDGIGFEMHEATTIFAPFQRLQHDIEGFGIGLATAYRIIQRHGGKMWAEGEKDAGASFYFTL